MRKPETQRTEPEFQRAENDSRPASDVHALDGFFCRMLIRLCAFVCRCVTPLLRWRLRGDGRQRLLVIRLDGIGDLILTSALFRELRAHYPAAHITAVVPAKAFELLRACPYLDVLLPYETRMSGWRRLRLWRVIGRAFCFRLRHGNALTADIAIAPRHVDLVKQEILLLLFCRAARRLAHWPAVREWATHFPAATTEVLISLPGRHVVRSALDFVSYLGGVPENEALEVWPQEGDRDFATALFSRLVFTECACPEGRGDRPSGGTGLLVALMPGASSPGRQWPPKRYGEVARWLIDRFGARVIVLGGPGDGRRAEMVVHYARSERCVSIAGACSLGATAEVVRRCGLYVGADTSCMHLAAAVGVPVVEVTPYTLDSPSPVSPVFYHPWRVAHRIVRPAVCLPPCRTECLVPLVPHCIMSISVPMVIAAIDELMAEPRT